MQLSDALKYATKVRASAADYHKTFDRLAADPKAGEGADAKALLPTEFYADHLRSEGHHPQADLIAQAMTHSKEQGEPVVYSEHIAKFPPHHRELLESLGQGDFHLVLGKPTSEYTNAVLYQRSHTDPSKVFGWTDSIDGTPEEVKAEVERFQRAGVPVELAIKPDSPQYQRWAKHFGIGGYSEEAEQYAAVKYVQETHADFKRAIHVNPEERTNALVYADWLQDQGKEAHAALIRKHTEEQGTGATLFADPTQEPTPVLTGDETAFDSDPAAYPNIRLHLHTASPEGGNLGWSATVPHTEWEQWEKKLAEEGAASVPFYLPQVPIEFGDAPLQWDLPEQHSSGERALKYINESHADFHNRILENPAETTPALVYADWLEENGKPAHAELLRKHVEQSGTGGSASTNRQIPYTYGTEFHYVPHTFGAAIHSDYETPSHSVVTLEQAGAKPEQSVGWGVRLPHKDALSLWQRVQSEGTDGHFSILPVGWRGREQGLEATDPVAEHFSAEQPIRYSAVPEHEIHEDYAPNGIAPRIGHTLKQLAQEDSTTGALAEGILRTGDHSILPILADRLEETDHPMASAFDWRHAPRAIRIDRALHRQISQRQVRHPDGHRVPLTAGWVLADIQDGVQRPAFSRRKALLAARLAVPDATTEDLLHSLFRLMDHREVADTAPELVEPVADHTKALTAARLQQLRQRQGDPYRYEDTRQPNKRVYKAEPVRYSHEAFQKAVAKDPKDYTSGLVYAEWLDDQGLDSHAELVREAANNRRLNKAGNHQHAEVVAEDFGHSPTLVQAYPSVTPDHWLLALSGAHTADSSFSTRHPRWVVKADTEKAQRLLSGLIEEGANPVLSGAVHAALLPPKEQPAVEPNATEDQKKYGSWRAPAGGMVVQQSPLAVSGQWAEGGEFVNDLQKLQQPVDYKKKPKKRLTVEYLRQHFRKRRTKGATGTYVVSGYGGQEGEADADAGAE